MWGNTSELCISDAAGRSHGDVNSDSLLVEPERCRIAKKQREEWTTHSAVHSFRTPNILLHTAAVQSVKPNSI